MDFITGISSIEKTLMNRVLNLFSSDKDSLQAMVTTMNKLQEKSSTLSPALVARHLSGYNIMQDIMMRHYSELVFGPKSYANVIPTLEQELDLDQVSSECNFYARLATAVYGDKIVYELSTSKKPPKTPAENIEQFLRLARIDPKQLVYSNWYSDSYHPAHCIVVLKERKEVVLVIRGTVSSGDAVTDLVACTMNFSVLKDEKGKNLITINSKSGGEINLNASFIQKENKSNGDNQNINAHEGIFTAGIELYTSIRGKLDEVFQALPADYKLIITGHSLGGGMTTAMTFLFVVNPLKYFANVELKGRVNGYSFAPPPVFDKAAAPFLNDHLVNIVNHFDLVPRLSYGSLKDLDDVVMDIHEREVYFYNILVNLMIFCRKRTIF